jgi:ribosomal protein S6--L-glutamate ligase
MKIGFILSKNDLSSVNSGMREVFSLLQERGVDVAPIYPESDFISLSPLSVDCDVYVLKSKSELALSLAGVLTQKGARILNAYSAAAFVQDKIRVNNRLQEIGVLVPNGYLTGSFPLVSEVTRKASALVKSHRRGADVGIEWVPQGESPDIIPNGGIFIQEISLDEGRSYKVYGIGEELFGLHGDILNYRKSQFLPGRLPEEVKRVALVCGRIFNLQVYGVDIVTTARGPAVIDLNPFPHIIGVPGGADRLAEFIYNFALDL